MSLGQSNVTRRFVRAVGPLVDFIYPPRCPSCGDAIGEHGGLCGNCWAELSIPAEPWCTLCQRPFGAEGPQGAAQCAPCLAKPPRHSGIYAATLYSPVSRKLLLAFKHGRRIAMAPMLARIMATRLPIDAEGYVIVPVPLHRWRLWKRGFNQSALLAQELARYGKGSLAVDLLTRRKPTPSLGGLGNKARRRALSGAIAIDPVRVQEIAGRDILLVDDVVTSGATSNACVATLLKAGARSVRIVCFARVLDEALDTVRTRPQKQTPETTGVPGAA